MLAFTLINLLPRTSNVPWMIFSAPGILFPLMALFIWLDTSRYRAYIPLFITGKCIGIFTLLSWSVVFGRVTFVGLFSDYYMVAELVFLSGDLLALATVVLIYRYGQNSTGRPKAVDTPDMEGK